MPPVPKPNHPRRIPKRGARTAFSKETREAIIERDKVCVRCGQAGEHIHHINFRSELTADVAHKRNGVLVCSTCHSYAHSGSEGRQFFLGFKEVCLDENGDRIL